MNQKKLKNQKIWQTNHKKLEKPKIWTKNQKMKTSKIWTNNAKKPNKTTKENKKNNFQWLCRSTAQHKSSEILLFLFFEFLFLVQVFGFFKAFCWFLVQIFGCSMFFFFGFIFVFLNVFCFLLEVSLFSKCFCILLQIFGCWFFLKRKPPF